MKKPKEVSNDSEFKKADFTDLFGTLKTKIRGQKLKDLARKGWGKD